MCDEHENITIPNLRIIEFQKEVKGKKKKIGIKNDKIQFDKDDQQIPLLEGHESATEVQKLTVLKSKESL